MNYGIKDSADLTIKEEKDSAIVLYTPYANVSTNEWTSDQVYANAKGTRAIRWDYNKQGTLQVEMEVFDLKWLSVLAGTDWETGTTDVFAREPLTASATNIISLSDTPKTGTLAIFKLNADNISHEDEQTEGDPVTNENEYSITGTDVTLNATTAPEGTKFVAYYMKDSASTTEQLKITANDYPESYEVFGETFIRPKDGGADKFVQMNWKNAKPMPNFTITLDASAATNLQITFDLFPDEDNNLATYTII